MLMPASLRRRLASEGGFTLVELLVAISIAMVVLTAALNLMGAMGRASSRITDKSDSAQALRIGLEQATRVLRTSVCADGNTPPIISGDASSVTFYSDTVGNTSSAFAPRKVRLRVEGGTLFQDTWNTTSTQAPWAYPTAPATTRILLEKVGNTSAFKYWAFDDLDDADDVAAPLNTDLSQTTLPANSIARIVRVDVTLTAQPHSNSSDARRQTTMTGSSYTRNADFSGVSNPGRTWGPRCA